MGIYISSYAVSAKDLEKAIGSNDNHSDDDVLKVVDDLFEGTALDIKSALKDLILNQPPYSRLIFITMHFRRYVLTLVKNYLTTPTLILAIVFIVILIL